MDSYKELQDQIAEEMHGLTVSCIKKLTAIWMESYEKETVETNLRMFLNHMSALYEELIAATTRNHKSIRKKSEDFSDAARYFLRNLQKDSTFIYSPEKDVPLKTTHKEVNESPRELRECYTRLLLVQKTLCQELGERPMSVSSLQTEKEFQALQHNIDSLKVERANRMWEIANLRQDIKKMLTELEIKIIDKEVSCLISNPSIAPTKANVDHLRKLKADYSKQIRKLRGSIDHMRKRLFILWECLDTNPSVQEKFAKYSEYSRTTYNMLYRELGRCTKEKRENIQLYSEKLIKKISLWSEKTLQSDALRHSSCRLKNISLEDLISLDEMELENLKNFYCDNEKIFNLISERKILWDRKVDLEAGGFNPDRYVNRGGQLLKEEKERKAINKKLPKIEAELKKLVREYEIRKKCKFLVYGEDILEIIDRDWKKSDKQNDKGKPSSARRRTPITPLLPSGSILLSDTKLDNPCINFLSMSFPKKRRHLDPNYLPGAAKRNLLCEMSTPKTIFKRQSLNRSQSKSPGKRSRVIATTIRGESARLSLACKNRRKSGRSPLNLPKVVVTCEDVDMDLTPVNQVPEPLGNDSPLVASPSRPPDLKHKTGADGNDNPNNVRCARALPKTTKIPVLRRSLSTSAEPNIQKSEKINGIIV